MPPLSHEGPNFSPKNLEELEIEQQMSAALVLVRGRMSDLIPAINPNYGPSAWLSTKKAMYQTKDQSGSEEYTYAWVNRRINQDLSKRSLERNIPTFNLFTATGTINGPTEENLINQLSLFDDDRYEFTAYYDLTPRQELELMNAVADTLDIIAKS
jgi:hypothetical protein